MKALWESWKKKKNTYVHTKGGGEKRVTPLHVPGRKQTDSFSSHWQACFFSTTHSRVWQREGAEREGEAEEYTVWGTAKGRANGEALVPLLGKNGRETRLVRITDTSSYRDDFRGNCCLGLRTGRCSRIRRSWLFSGIRGPGDKTVG